MATKIKAYKISPENVKKNKMPDYYGLMEGVAQISPVKIRNISSYHYHVAEDVQGNVYLIDDAIVDQYRLVDRNLGVSETEYMLDGFGRTAIAKAKAVESANRPAEVVKTETLQEDNNEVELNTEESKDQGDDNE